MKKLLILVFQLVLLLAFANVAVASQTLFADNGILYAVSKRAVTKVDMDTGERSITYADGHAVYWHDSASSDQTSSPQNAVELMSNNGVSWLASKEGLRPSRNSNSRLDRSSDFSLQGTDCSRQAEALQEAVDAVESACGGGGGGSAACGQAQTLLNYAYNDYMNCLSAPPDTID